MAIYEYVCARDGVREASWPLGRAPESVSCDVCGEQATRVFSVPSLPFSSGLPRGVVATMDRAERSRTEPDVVSSVPPRRRPAPTAPLTPALRRLPRP
jgi:hypothetical protein